MPSLSYDAVSWGHLPGVQLHAASSASASASASERASWGRHGLRRSVFLLACCSRPNTTAMPAHCSSGGELAQCHHTACSASAVPADTAKLWKHRPHATSLCSSNEITLSCVPHTHLCIVDACSSSTPRSRNEDASRTRLYPSSPSLVHAPSRVFGSCRLVPLVNERHRMCICRSIWNSHIQNLSGLPSQPNLRLC